MCVNPELRTWFTATNVDEVPGITVIESPPPTLAKRIDCAPAAMITPQLHQYDARRQLCAARTVATRR